MSNLPDNFNEEAFNRAWGDGGFNEDDYAKLYDAQQAYRECVAACIQVLKKRNISWLSAEDIGKNGMFSSIEEFLDESIAEEVARLRDEGCCDEIRGDFPDKFFAEQYAIYKGEQP